ncbi:hypothetical protein BH23PLA1_BH23PLA1_39640 [soil metagenome]
MRILPIVAILAFAPATALAQEKIDLRTKEGVEKVQGHWKFHDIKIVEVPGKNPDGSENTTYNIEPNAGEATRDDLDEEGWETLDPTTLGQPRSTGQICFCWYRINVTLPDEVEGKKVEFVTTVDDYGEVWVDGRLPRQVGQSGGSIVAGFNAPNRVELPDAEPGKSYQIAIFGINGPISAAPGNWIFLRETYLELTDK